MVVLDGIRQQLLSELRGRQLLAKGEEANENGEKLGLVQTVLVRGLGAGGQGVAMGMESCLLKVLLDWAVPCSGPSQNTPRVFHAPIISQSPTCARIWPLLCVILPTYLCSSQTTPLTHLRFSAAKA